MTAIFVVNQSTEVRSGDVQLMARACAAQVRHHAAPLWGLAPIPVVYLPSHHDAPPGSWVISVLDDPDQANALGWHTEDQGDVIYGRVFARPVLDNGGSVLSGGPVTVSSVLSHEVLETLVDPHVCSWSMEADGTLWATEVCDPVEAGQYVLNSVMVSDFVTPAFFDSQAAAGSQLSWLSAVQRPFTLDSGGYAVVLPPGHKVPTEIFGETYPEWRKATKRVDTGRSARRHPSQPAKT